MMGVFRECTNPECTLRYPDLYNCESKITPCPMCAAPSVIVKQVKLIEEEDHYHDFFHKDCNLIPVLENLRSVFNVGSIFRTVNGFGIQQIYLCGITPTPLHKNFSKTSLHAEKTIEWIYHKNSLDAVNNLRGKNFQIISLEMTDNSIPIFDLNRDMVTKKFALIVGNENFGIDPEIVDQSDLVVSIPMLGTKKSFNVCVAVGIALFQFYLLVKS